jgi:peptide/nickel transport system permease protein
MGDVLRGNLGISYVSRTAVGPQLATAIPATVELVLYSFVVCAVLGVLAGMSAAWRPRRLGTRLIRGTSILGTALPVFWFAIILQLVLGARLSWFPIESRLGANTIPPPHITGLYTLDALLSGQWAALGDAALHLVLPVVALVAWMFALTSRVSEKSFATELTRPYVQTAMARGVSPRRLLGRHVLRNALNPIITVLGLQFGWLLGGTVLVEVVFAWGGVGSYMYTALQNFDYPVIEAVTLVITVAFVIVNLAVDLLYPVIDPRVRRR